MAVSYYYCTTTDFGADFVRTNGGFYEAIKDGTPQPVYAGNEYIGFETSSTPEVCASKSPEAALFAVIHNEKRSGVYHIYATTHTPDVDISTAGFDFNILEEVRYQNPDDDPIAFTRAHTVSVPHAAVEDVGNAYDDETPTIASEWAEAVKDGLATLIATGGYPEELEWDNPYAEWDQYRP